MLICKNKIYYKLKIVYLKIYLATMEVKTYFLKINLINIAIITLNFTNDI